MDDLRYPIGPFRFTPPATPETRRADIVSIAGLPARLREAVVDLDEQQLSTPYRPEGWTVRQLVHHVADSHINAYTRFRLAMTEEQPTVRPYDEKSWAQLEDAREAPIEISLTLLDRNSLGAPSLLALQRSGPERHWLVRARQTCVPLTALHA